MTRNLLLLQNGFPGSKTSGTEIDTLNIKNFFKYEKNVSSSKYALERRDDDANNANQYYGTTPHTKVYNMEYFEKITGELKPDSEYLHYSISPLLFAVRTNKGFAASNVLITSRLMNDNLSLRFIDVGETVEDFQALNNVEAIFDGWGWRSIIPHHFLQDSITIPSVSNINHCFFAVLFSSTAYSLESGTVLLNNEPLFNISWTETEFVTE